MFYIRLLDTGKCEQMYWFLHYTIKSNSDWGKNIQKGRTDEADSIFDELISYKKLFMQFNYCWKIHERVKQQTWEPLIEKNGKKCCKNKSLWTYSVWLQPASGRRWACRCRRWAWHTRLRTGAIWTTWRPPCSGAATSWSARSSLCRPARTHRRRTQGSLLEALQSTE